MLCRRILSLIPVHGARSCSRVTITDDGSTLVALHPPEDFPYELSQPLTAKEPSSHYLGPLKNASSEVMHLIKSEAPAVAIRRLAAITMTCEHRWYPRGRNVRRRKPKIEEDRPYL